MKQKLISTMIAAIAASSMASVAAADDATVYGKLNVSLNNVDYDGGDDEWKLSSNASRIGLKGSFDINEGLKAIYKMEYEVAVDDGNADDDEFKQRNIYGGFQGNFGTVIAGHHDTPTKLIQDKVDRFNDLENGDIKNIFAGENRESNIIMYSTPSMNGLSATIALMPGEDTGTNDGLADSTSIAITYKKDELYLALANDSEVNGTDVTRFVAEYTINDFNLGFMLQDAETIASSADHSGYLFSGDYKLNENIVLKAQYGSNEIEDQDVSQFAIGADYKLNSNAKFFAYISNIDYDGQDNKALGMGYEIKF
jgi:predicted porin